MNIDATQLYTLLFFSENVLSTALNTLKRKYNSTLIYLLWN